MGIDSPASPSYKPDCRNHIRHQYLRHSDSKSGLLDNFLSCTYPNALYLQYYDPLLCQTKADRCLTSAKGLVIIPEFCNYLVQCMAHFSLLETLYLFCVADFNVCDFGLFHSPFRYIQSNTINLPSSFHLLRSTSYSGNNLNHHCNILQARIKNKAEKDATNLGSKRSDRY